MRGSPLHLRFGLPDEAVPGGGAFARALVIAFMAALLALPGTALGAQPIERFHVHFTDIFSDEVCGIPVEIDLVVTDIFVLYADDTFRDTSSASQTFTNPVNGESVILSSAGIVTGSAVVNEEAGTVTFFTTFKGLPEKIQSANGSVLTRDAGIITFADTFDLETGEFISAQITAKGPHPEADSDFALFCEVISEALS